MCVGLGDGGRPVCVPVTVGVGVSRVPAVAVGVATIVGVAGVSVADGVAEAVSATVAVGVLVGSGLVGVLLGETVGLTVPVAVGVCVEPALGEGSGVPVGPAVAVAGLVAV